MAAQLYIYTSPTHGLGPLRALKQLGLFLSLGSTIHLQSRRRLFSSFLVQVTNGEQLMLCIHQLHSWPDTVSALKDLQVKNICTDFSYPLGVLENQATLTYLIILQSTRLNTLRGCIYSFFVRLYGEYSNEWPSYLK